MDLCLGGWGAGFLEPYVFSNIIIGHGCKIPKQLETFKKKKALLRDPRHGRPGNEHPGNAYPGNDKPGNGHPGNAHPGNAHPASHHRLGTPADGPSTGTQATGIQATGTQATGTHATSTRPHTTGQELWPTDLQQAPEQPAHATGYQAHPAGLPN